MLDTRWIKLLRDLQMTPWRIALMLVCIALGLFVFTGLLSSYSLLTREVRSNYLATNPAAASLQVDHIDSALLDSVRHFPGIDQVQAAAAYKTNFSFKDGPLQPLIIFLVEDFSEIAINKITPEAGAWPPLPNSILLERDSLSRRNIRIGDSINILLANGSEHALDVSGTVHDPAMPVPSYAAYGYAAPDTLSRLGVDIPVSDLRITFADKTLTTEGIEKAISQLAHWIQAKGYKVSRIRVPPAGEHPHQGIIFSVLGVFIFFSAIALVLSAILTATIIDGLMAQQRRQIGIMKAIGASDAQIASIYLGFIFLLSALATLVGLPAGIAFGRACTRMVLGFLNFNLLNPAVPANIYCALITTGIVLPLLIATVPILKATQVSVQHAFTHTGATYKGQATFNPGSWLYHLPGFDRSLLMALRNSFRYRGRLLLILLLLGSGGAMFMSSLNLNSASQQHLAAAAAERRYDLEVNLAQANDPQKIKNILQKLANVAQVEAWVNSTVSPYRTDGLMIESTHLDGGHGQLTLSAVPAMSHLLQLTMEQGQWPDTIPDGKVILNHSALESFPNTKVGDSISINISGKPLRLQVIGIARQKMSGKMLYLSASTYENFTGHTGRTSYRLVTQYHDTTFIDDTAAKVETALKAEQIQVSYTVTETRLRHEIDGHFTMLARALQFVAILMGAVGVFSLASVMSIHVAERTREIGIMRSIGASSGIIARNIIIEGVFIGFISCILAIVLSLPLSQLASHFIGKIVFDAAFPLSISHSAIWTWFFFAIAGAIIASLYPAKKAIKLGIRDCLSAQ